MAASDVGCLVRDIMHTVLEVAHMQWNRDARKAWICFTGAGVPRVGHGDVHWRCSRNGDTNMSRTQQR